MGRGSKKSFIRANKSTSPRMSLMKRFTSVYLITRLIPLMVKRGTDVVICNFFSFGREIKFIETRARDNFWGKNHQARRRLAKKVQGLARETDLIVSHKKNSRPSAFAVISRCRNPI